MKILLLDRLPKDTHGGKAANPSASRIMGASVYETEVVQALLEHGSYDEYVFLDGFRTPESGARDLPAFASGSSRARVVTADRLITLKDVRAAVIMTTGPMIAELMPIRVLCNRSDWPVVGFIHALHVAAVNWVLPSLLADVAPGDTVVCSSEGGRKVVEHLIQRVNDRIRELTGKSLEYPVSLPVIPLGTDCATGVSCDKGAARVELGIDSDAVVLLYFGRFSTISKCDLGPLLHAFARVPEQPILIVAGDDTRQQAAGALREYAVRLGCGDRVTVLPNPSPQQKRLLYRAADVFVSPSDNVQETFGITLIEALAAGLPVVASDWDGYREIVRDGRTGLLVPSYWPPLGDELDVMRMCDSADRDATLAGCTVVEVDALARAMTTLVRNPDLRAKMGEAGRLDAKARFDWPVIVRKYEELWEHMLECARNAPPRVPRLGPTSYPQQKAFAHYPSYQLTDERTVALTEEGRTWLTAPIPLTALPDGKTNFSLDVLLRITRRACDVAQIPIGALVSAEVRDGAPPTATRLHVARLLKYGILQETGLHGANK